MLQLQHSSLINTIAKKVNSFQNCLSQQLHWTRQFFLPLRNTFTCFHSLRFCRIDLNEFRFAYVTYVIHVVYSFRKIRTHDNVFYFSVSLRVSSSHASKSLTNNSLFKDVATCTPRSSYKSCTTGDQTVWHYAQHGTDDGNPNKILRSSVEVCQLLVFYLYCIVYVFQICWID